MQNFLPYFSLPLSLYIVFFSPSLYAFTVVFVSSPTRATLLCEMASHAASFPTSTPSGAKFTSTASEVHSEQTALPPTAHLRSGATAASSAAHIGNSPPFLCVNSLSTSLSCSEGKREAGKVEREGNVPVPPAALSNVRRTPAEIGEARAATAGPSAPSDASSSTAASFPRAPQPSPKNSAVETNDVVFAPVVDGDVRSIMKDYYGIDLNWASSPTNEKNTNGKTASQTPARSSLNASVAGASGNAPAPHCKAAHTAAAPTTNSTTAMHAPPTPVRNLSSTPAATSLRRCHIPPIALLDGPQRRDSGGGASTKDTAAASASSVAGPAVTTAAGPSVKRGSRLNTPFANIGRAAPAQPGALPQLGNTRPARVPRVSFHDGDVVALPDSQALRPPAMPLLVFRNPTMRERGKETMAAPGEVYAQLLQRGAAVCTLAVVDEDAVRQPCLVASGFSVRVFEEDRALALGKGRIAHGAMKVLHSFRNRLRSGGGGDGGRDADAGGRRLSADAVSNDRSASGSEISGDAPAAAPAGSSSGSILMVPGRKDGRSRSADVSAEAHPSEFERFLHKIVFDEALSRPKGESGCDSVTLQLLARRWEAGQNACLILGNGSGRSIQCFDVAVGVVKDAMAKLRARLRDPASTAELQMHMGDVFAENGSGRVRVQDLLVRGTGSDSDTSSTTSDAGELNATAGVAAEEEEQRRFPQVRIARSPLMGTFATGLSVVTAADAMSDASAIFGALGRGFHQYNVSTHSSRNGSFSSAQSTANAATLGAHTCFAVLRLRTVCRGKDMRSAPLSAREATSLGEERVSRRQQHQNKKGASAVPVLHHRTTECAADVFVSTLLLTFFGTEHHVLKSIVENTLIALKQARGGAFVVAPEQLRFSPTEWADPVHFLYSLMRDALGGRTHTAACLCLSEYDSRVTPWLHVMERARAILNSEPHNGNLRSYLHYLLEQYENMDAQQRREKKGMGARRAEGRGDRRPSEISMYFVQKLVSSLDQYLASPAGEPPLLERLEIKNADVLPAVSADPVSAPALTAGDGEMY